MTLDDARKNIGERVMYFPSPASGGEAGTITSVNDKYVFVLFAGDQGSKACDPATLTLMLRS